MRPIVRPFESAVTALFALAAFAVTPPDARADGVTPPTVPEDLQVPAGNEAFLVGHASGTQDYICLLSPGGGFGYALFTPQATLLGDDDEQVITHFFSPNPSENRTIRATWQHSRDSSSVWAKVIHAPSTDPRFVAPGAVAWLLLERAGVQDGPTGGATLSATTFVQRVNTHGGVAPSTGCASAVDIGKKAFVPYTADYFFYRAAAR